MNLLGSLKHLLLIFVLLLNQPYIYFTVAVTFSFDGSQYLTISLTNQSVTEVEYVSVRFKTDRENGLLFTTSSSTTEDKLTVSLDRGRIRVDINLAGVRQVSCTLMVNNVIG